MSAGLRFVAEDRGGLRDGTRALLVAGRLPAGERRRLALATLLAAGAMAAAIGLLATSGYLISRAAQRPEILSLMVAIVAVRALGLARAGLRYGERLASHDLALRQLARLRVRFFERLAPLVPERVRHGGADLLTRFVCDVDAVSDLYLRALIPALVAVVVIAGAGVAAWLMLPVAGVALLVSLLAAAVALPALSAAVAARTDRRQAAARASLMGELVETIEGAEELSMLGRAGRERVERLRSADARLSRLARSDALSASLATALGGALSGAGLLAVLLVAIPAVHSGALSGVLLAALAFLLLAAYESVAALPAAARSLRSCAASARRLRDVARSEHAVLDPSQPRRPAGTGALCASGVGFAYEAGGRRALNDVELSLRPGERVALVGPSGAGKTTLAELLVRFHDPLCGHVTLDGIDVRELAQDELRRSVLLCAQDAHLFNASLRENVLLARRSASEQEIEHALEAVELSDLVSSLPDGLDTLVGADGELLSGGQRQRVALARALLSDARFLILDEPTAHLDAGLAERVLANVLAARDERRGVLIVTHDPALAARCDRTVAIAAPS